MTGEPTHTASKERMAPELMFHLNARPMQLSRTVSKVQWPLRFAVSYVQPVTQRYRRKTVEEVPLQQSSHHENTTICAPPPDYQLLSSFFIYLFSFFLFFSFVVVIKKIRLEQTNNS